MDNLGKVVNTTFKISREHKALNLKRKSWGFHGQKDKEGKISIPFAKGGSNCKAVGGYT